MNVRAALSSVLGTTPIAQTPWAASPVAVTLDSRWRMETAGVSQRKHTHRCHPTGLPLRAGKGLKRVTTACTDRCIFAKKLPRNVNNDQRSQSCGLKGVEDQTVPYVHGL